MNNEGFTRTNRHYSAYNLYIITTISDYLIQFLRNLTFDIILTSFTTCNVAPTYLLCINFQYF